MRKFVLGFFVVGLIGCLSVPFNSPYHFSSDFSDETLQVGLFDSLEPVFKDSIVEKERSYAVGDYAKNSYASVVLFVRGGGELVVDSISAQIKEGSSLGEIEISRLVDVPVEANTGIHARTENIDGKRNPYVIRRAPFRIYEAIVPFDGGRIVAQDSAAFYIEVPILEDSLAKKYYCDISVASGDKTFSLTWEFLVHDFVLTSDASQELGYTNWFHLDNIALESGSEIYSDKFFEMLEKYAKLMRKGRQNTFWLPWGVLFDVEGDEVSLNEERALRFVNIFLSNGFTQIEGGQFAGRTNGDWNAPTLTVSGKYLATSAEAEQYLATTLTALNDFLVKYNLKDMFVTHIADEPVDSHAQDYIVLASIVRKYLPGVKIFEATKSRESVVGAVDMWCPTLDQYQLNKGFFDARKEAGDDVWVYSCLDPGGQWLNRLLDQEHLRQVYIPWLCALFDLDGFLHWGGNFYKAGTDPYNLSVRPFFDAGGPAAERNQLPAGDSHIFYPSENGPNSSLRFEAHREGFEDYLVLKELQKRDSKIAKFWIQYLVTSFRSYSTDVMAYRRVKAEILRAVAD
ncbi:MAG: DUF4091 domain-containing protein [Spirochaetales bacterium]|nr:DUF4091 domain-containing protein [Spirochaetales bacterium]